VSVSRGWRLYQGLGRRAKDVVGLFACEPVYKNQTKFTMFRRYVHSFGVWNAMRLAVKVIAAKVRNLLRIGFKDRRFFSVAAVAAYYGVPLFRPRDVNAKEFLGQLASMGVEVILSVSCPQIFKGKLISLPARGCLNLHGADLPNYRGLMPSFWMLANGEEQAGVTLFYVNAGIDTGDVAGKRIFPILPTDTLDSFIRRSKQEACDLALEVLEAIEAGTVTRTPLEGEGSYFGWPTREAYRRFRQRGRRLW
jgi:methionyl-tRNA formyltransferase